MRMIASSSAITTRMAISGYLGRVGSSGSRGDPVEQFVLPALKFGDLADEVETMSVKGGGVPTGIGGLELGERSLRDERSESVIIGF